MSIESIKKRVELERMLADPEVLPRCQRVPLKLADVEALIELAECARELGYTKVSDYWMRQDREQKLWDAYNKIEAME